MKRPVLSTNKFGHCGDDGRRFRTVEGLAVGKEHSGYVWTLSHRLLSDDFSVRLRDQIGFVEDEKMGSGSSNHVTES